MERANILALFCWLLSSIDQDNVLQYFSRHYFHKSWKDKTKSEKMVECRKQTNWKNIYLATSPYREAASIPKLEDGNAVIHYGRPDK